MTVFLGPILLAFPVARGTISEPAGRLQRPTGPLQAFLDLPCIGCRGSEQKKCSCIAGRPLQQFETVLPRFFYRPLAIRFFRASPQLVTPTSELRFKPCNHIERSPYSSVMLTRRLR